jgi:hypothetical protein
MKKITFVFAALLFMSFIHSQSISNSKPIIWNIDSNGNQTSIFSNVTLDCNVVNYRIKANFTDLGNTSSYRVESIPFAPQRFLNINGGSGNPIPPTFGQIISTLPDDVWSAIQNLQTNGNNLNFCFFGQQKSQFVVSSNGAICFDISKAGGFSPWQIMNMGKISPNGDMDISATAGLDYNDSILAPLHDTNPTDGDATNSSYIFWEIRGIAPNRIFIFGTHDMPMFQCGASFGRATHQMLFYETTNIIEFHIQDKPICDTWAGGFAGLGIQNANSTVGYSAPGRDNLEHWQIVSDPINNPFNNTYSALPVESWRFIPDGGGSAARPIFEWIDEAGQVISNSQILDINTANFTNSATTYTARLTYTNECNSEITISEKTVTFNKCLPICEPEGSVIISEIMQNPSVDDNLGEWFELYNTTASSIDLQGWSIIDNNDSTKVFTISNSLIIPANSYLLFANNANPLTNGGLPTPDYVYDSTFVLNNNVGGFTIQCSGNMIDSVNWDNTYPLNSGSSMSLNVGNLNATDNNVNTSWETVLFTYGNGDSGTPGGQNNMSISVFDNDINKFNISPNPTNSELTINANIANNERIKLSIFNILGKQVKTYDFKNVNSELFNTIIDVSSLYKGQYYIRLVSSNGTVINKPFIKN